jgi:gliding motility-associated-like protein
MVNEPGIYTVRVTNTDGCYKDRSVTVLGSNIAIIDTVEILDASQNNTITILISGDDGDYEYALDDINGPYQVSNRFDNVTAGFHTVYVRDTNDCGISEKLISVIGFPKFFTPNDDTYNDFWQVYGVNEQFQPNTMIYIYDRHGKLIKELEPLSKGWDGTLNGYNLPASDYWFHVTLQDGRLFRGHFALKR